MNNVHSYKALNDSTLRITLKTAFPPFLGLLSMPYCSVVPEEVVSQTSFRDAPVGTGPFIFEDWKRGDRLILAKNAEWYDAQSVSLEKVEFRFISDAAAATAAMLIFSGHFAGIIVASYVEICYCSAGLPAGGAAAGAAAAVASFCAAVLTEILPM